MFFLFCLSDWANLPIDVLSLIYDRLSVASDCVQFIAVCRSWRCMKKDRKYKRARLTTPMVFVSERKENTWNAYDFVNNQVLGFQLKLPKTRFCGSSNGWIITVENFVVTLRNPQYDVKGRTERPSIIRLPPLKPQVNYKLRGYVKAHSDYFVIKATMSADPISNSKDCIVMVLYEPLSQLAFIRLGKDTRWTYIDKHGDEIFPWITDVVLIEDKIYAVDAWSKLWAFDSTSKSIVDVQLVATGIADEPQKMYLVGSKKKGLLLIYRFSEYRLFTRESRKFRIFELSSNDEWIEKNDLGDLALFLGDNDPISVVASMHSRCQSNCIYFVNDNERINCRHTFDDFGVYNVKSQNVTKPALLRNPVKRTMYPPFMFQPIVYM
ncbi:hypothetical protein ACFX2I_041973 [Malus domestica]